MPDGGLRQDFRKNLPRFDWQAIESGITGAGIPDLNGCLKQEFWIECKRVLHIKVTFQPYQLPWIERRVRHGGRVFIACRRNDMLYLYPGEDVRSVFVHGLKHPPMLHCTGGIAKWDWDAIAKALTQ